MKKINIAIDGYSSCGKSTLTKQLAQKLGYKYVDTGAMYRGVTLYFLQNSINFEDEIQIAEALKKIHLNFKFVDQRSSLFLNGQYVEEEIRSMKVSSNVSEVAAISSVRKFLVKQQQQIAVDKGIVMDGRDIGTVVLPNAELKLFMTADKEIRVERRYLELLANGREISRIEIQKNLEHRDFIDTHRKDSPLAKAEDAILLDNTNMTMQEQLDFAYDLVQKRIEEE